jgi:hypothetical protein
LFVDLDDSMSLSIQLGKQWHCNFKRYSSIFISLHAVHVIILNKHKSRATHLGLDIHEDSDFLTSVLQHIEHIQTCMRYILYFCWKAKLKLLILYRKY